MPYNLQAHADFHRKDRSLQIPVERVMQQQLDVYNRRDLEAWLATCAPGGLERIKMICLYDVHAGLIRKATFAMGQARAKT